MTIEDANSKLAAVLKGLPASGFDTVSDAVIEELLSLAGEAGNLEMKSGKKLIENLAEAIKARKSDDSVRIRVDALAFYLKNLESGTTEDL